jgi:hypothetical protein
MATRGDIAEAAVLAALVKLGLDVLMPFRQDGPYDLLVHLPGERFVRVQCKAGRERDGCVVFNSAGTDHGRGRLDYRGRADVFGVFCPSLDRVFIVPVEEAAGFMTTLRLHPSRNNQRRRVRDAESFAVERWVQRRLARHEAAQPSP